MKRILSLILALLILLTATAAVADDEMMTPEELHKILLPSLEPMNDEAIRVMLCAIQIELFNRGKSTVIPQGEYMVGEDIPAGRYTFTGIGNKPYSTIWHYPKGGISNYYTISNDYGLSVSLTLKNGDRIRVDYQEVKIGPYVGLTW